MSIEEQKEVQKEAESKPEYAYNDEKDTLGKLFVGGLSWDTTDKSLRYYFEKYGEVLDVTLMSDKKTGQPRGFGFVAMKDPAACDIIVTTEHTIDGKIVDVKRAVTRDQAPAPAKSESKKIFVGGLPIQCTEKEFADYFNKYGNVKDAVIMIDRDTNTSRGFGFITFDTDEEVDKVLKASNHLIMGKPIELKRAQPRDGPRDGPKPATSGGYGGYGGGRGYSPRAPYGGGDRAPYSGYGGGGGDSQGPPRGYSGYSGYTAPRDHGNPSGYSGYGGGRGGPPAAYSYSGYGASVGYGGGRGGSGRGGSGRGDRYDGTRDDSSSNPGYGGYARGSTDDSNSNPGYGGYARGSTDDSGSNPGYRGYTRGSDSNAPPRGYGGYSGYAAAYASSYSGNKSSEGAVHQGRPEDGSAGRSEGRPEGDRGRQEGDRGRPEGGRGRGSYHDRSEGYHGGRGGGGYQGRSDRGYRPY